MEVGGRVGQAPLRQRQVERVEGKRSGGLRPDCCAAENPTRSPPNLFGYWLALAAMEGWWCATPSPSAASSPESSYQPMIDRGRGEGGQPMDGQYSSCKHPEYIRPVAHWRRGS